jgi:hypothetical protein
MSESEDPPREPGAAPRYARRLSDKILIAFHQACDQADYDLIAFNQACDQADYDVAEQLLHILEQMLKRRPTSSDTNRRRSMESLVAAHERLWYLRHPDNPGA